MKHIVNLSRLGDRLYKHSARHPIKGKILYNDMASILTKFPDKEERDYDLGERR